MSGGTRGRALVAGALLWAGAGGPGAGWSQDPGAPGGARRGVPAEAASRSAARPEERPSWLYPRDLRRDPAAAPTELYRATGRADLHWRASMMDPEAPARSSAVVVLGGSGGARVVVRAGDRIGGFRILRVETDRVVAVQRILGADRLVVAPAPGDTLGSSAP